MNEECDDKALEELVGVIAELIGHSLPENVGYALLLCRLGHGEVHLSANIEMRDVTELFRSHVKAYENHMIYAERRVSSSDTH